ncbi:Vacuolar protein sorting-associated protein atg6 [Vermiconidia calcicola]|uniref:Vacuolar protein sorting-associated protein atg6 n=1 Tax=Vermiconidia calcicola TaxID=1690605 RepID=A0ACC3NLA4_9PEZI|nr:Vacuolar protein sorting-associated protein atg6 [Vermiconidia calcicola]
MAPLYCQKCRTQLKLDPSLEDLNPASFKILADAAPILEPNAPEEPRSAAAKQRRQHYDEVSKDAGPAMQKRTLSGTPRTGSKMTPDMSFIVLSESQIAPGGPEEVVQTPTKKKAAPKKAEPVVTDREEKKRQSSVIRERDAYVDFLKKAQEDVPTDEERKKTKRDLEDAQRREKQALEELEALEAEKAKMEDEIAALDAEAEDLDEEEERFWRERNAFTAELNAFQQERDSLQTQLAHDTRLLESLQRTNVYNDTFVIGHDGLFGTINGLRLGRLPDHPIEWAEINAAWGQVVLLLVVVAEKLGYSFRDYKLVPVGSTSKIVKYDTKQQPTGDSKPKGNVLELFSSGNLSLGLGLFHGKFDDAMVAFLDCLRLVGEHVAHTSTAAGATGIKLPYLIHKDKIGEVSIRLGNFGPDEQWTKACKYTLTCCKFLLAHASHVDDAKNAR